MLQNLHDIEFLYSKSSQAAGEITHELNERLDAFREKLPEDQRKELREIEDLFAAETGAIQACLIEALRELARRGGNLMAA